MRAGCRLGGKMPLASISGDAVTRVNSFGKKEEARGKRYYSRIGKGKRKSLLLRFLVRANKDQFF